LIFGAKFAIQNILVSDDEDIIGAVHEAMAMTGGFWDEDEDEDPPTFL
jgi:hypothetical protein